MTTPSQAEMTNKYADDTKIQCTECPKAFDTKRQIYFHKKVVHGPEIYPCDVCGKKFRTHSYAKKHKLLLHINERNFKCDACGSQFKCKEALTSHEKRVHLKQFDKFCGDCGKGFFSYNTLREHQRVKHDKILYSCTYCDKQFESRRGLLAHVDYHVEAKYSCPLCKETFKFRWHFDRHGCKQKNGKIKYVCDKCGVELGSKQNLKKHMNAHDGIKLYKCDVCGETLASSGNLLVHKRIHTDEKPYACTFCEKRFRQKPPLTLHMRTHTGELPYHCEVCLKNFISKAVLKSHKCQGLTIYTDTESE